MPLLWQLWLLLLVVANMVAPLFFLDHFEAQLVIGTFFASMMFMTLLTHLAGFTRILGLGHILWIPLLSVLWFRLGFHAPSDSFGIWLRILMTLNGVSLVLDGMDVVRYVAGDRGETVRGLDS